MFKRIIFKIISISFIAISYSTAYAFTHQEPLNNNWKITIAPYIWGTSMNGRVGVASQSAQVDQSFSDILKQLDMAGMLALDVERNGVGLFFNGMYASMSDHANNGPYSVHDRNQFSLISGGISYEIYNHYIFGHSGLLKVQPYAGFRYTENNVTLTFDVPAQALTLKNNQYWTDPIVGMRLISAFYNGFNINIAGDVGGLNRSTQYSYNVMALLGYQPQTRWKNTRFYAGYRLLDQHYQHGNGLQRFDWDMKIAGPILGVAFTL